MSEAFDKCSNMRFSIEPKDTDILSGRGGRSNHHPGNERYRQLISGARPFYSACPKFTKLYVSKAIVQIILDEGGRFLERFPSDGLWYQISYEKAVSKTSQGLRERQKIPRVSKKRPSLCSNDRAPLTLHAFLQETIDRIRSREGTLSQSEERRNSEQGNVTKCGNATVPFAPNVVETSKNDLKVSLSPDLSTLADVAISVMNNKSAGHELFDTVKCQPKSPFSPLIAPIHKKMYKNDMDLKMEKQQRIKTPVHFQNEASQLLQLLQHADSNKGINLSSLMNPFSGLHPSHSLMHLPRAELSSRAFDDNILSLEVSKKQRELAQRLRVLYNLPIY